MKDIYIPDINGTKSKKKRTK